MAQGNRHFKTFIYLAVLGACTGLASCNDLWEEPFSPGRSTGSNRPLGSITAASFTPLLISYLGGSGDELARDVATDPLGNLYFAGSTSSLNFPVTANGFDRSFNSLNSARHDGYLTKVDPAGQIAWSTYLGGTGFDRVYALEVDKSGNVYVAGRAGPNFPVTPNVFQVAFAGGDGGGNYGQQDGFVCKFRPDGTPVFCSYFGDSDGLTIRDVAVDDVGDIYVGAATSVGGFPASWFANAFQKTVRGGTDLVIAKIRGDGSRVLWATYLGGSANEISTPTVRVDAAKNVYVFSGTMSSDIPVVNGFDQTLGGASDGYVAKLSTDGSALLWSTYLGGSGKELSETHSMAIDPITGDVVIAAGTTSTDFPTTAGTAQTSFGGIGELADTGAGTNYPGDAFVTRIAADGSRILASTYIGGLDGDGAEGVWIDRTSSVFVSGTTFSKDFPAPVGSSVSRGDMFVARLSGDLTMFSSINRFGGSKFDVGRACFVDDAGAFYAVGDFKSGSLVTLNAFQNNYSGGLEAVILKFAPSF